jgi:hypothetical protein
MMKQALWKSIVLIVGFCLAQSCTNETEPEEALYDGHKLFGSVTDSISGLPVDSATVRFERIVADSFRVRYCCKFVDENGQFEFVYFPGTIPSRNEVLQFVKDGYKPKRVWARTATRVERFRYRLNVQLVPVE